MSNENTKVVREQGGEVVRIDSGGKISIASGGVIEILSGGILDVKTGGIVKANGTQASAITALTDNSAGTADNTIAAMPDPADAPSTADDLREDLVANLLPALRNNIADLTAKVNAINTAIKNAGITA